MTRQLVMIHGRAQEKKDSRALKAEWLEALGKGLAKSNLRLPIPEHDVRLPFYGDALFDLISGAAPEHVAAVIVRGTPDHEEARFQTGIMQEACNRAGVTEEEIAQEIGGDVLERGILNTRAMLALARLLGRHVPGSGAILALFTHDVYRYFKNEAIRAQIDEGVMAALTRGVETVVVAHSLGTVVAYNVLRKLKQEDGWKVPWLVTAGSPLGVLEIQKTLRGSGALRCPECVGDWFNAADSRDIVALYPLTPQYFPLNPVTPAIENKTDVFNHTENRHGIEGYLENQATAKKIYDALTARGPGHG